MIELVQYTKVNSSIFFFSRGNKEGMREEVVSDMIDRGFINISREQFDKILKSL